MGMYVDEMSSSIHVGKEEGCLWSVENKDGMEIGTEEKEEVSEGILRLWPQYQGQKAA